MPKFVLRFERYQELSACISIDADDLDEAIAQAWSIDGEALTWQVDAEDDATDPRLSAVADDTGKALATMQLPGRTWMCSWTHVDLRKQWSSLEQAPLEPELANDIQDILGHYSLRLQPVMEDATRAEVLRCRLEKKTSQVRGKRRSTRL